MEIKFNLILTNQLKIELPFIAYSIFFVLLSFWEPRGLLGSSSMQCFSCRTTNKARKKTCIFTLMTINSTRYGGWEVWIIEYTNYSVMYNTWRLAGSRVTTRRTGGKTRKPSSACATAPLTSFRSSRRVTSYLYSLFGWARPLWRVSLSHRD